ncbi:p-nitrophenyl phosphatase [Panaeolus papilionaceus]|nr:p-nitrophenyl phosphatase [Panaeolus papilionaceus]
MTYRLTTSEDYQKLLDDYDTWLFDCDGVLWCGDRLIDGVAEYWTFFDSEIVFVTNNATKSRQNYRHKFEQLGIKAEVDEIYGSAYTSAVYLSSHMYVIGMAGLEEELREEGITFLGGTDPQDNTLEPFDLTKFTQDPDVAAVVCGGDTQINYTKLSKAYRYLLTNSDCHFVVTNEDSTFPSTGGILPGAGSLFTPLRYALNRNPVCTGKPSSVMLDCIRSKVNFDPSRTIMVGDRLNTDIQLGQNGGFSTLVVFTGITAENEIFGPYPSPIVPNFATNALGDLRQSKNAQ